MPINNLDWEQRHHHRALKSDGDVRSPFQRDKARIMHSASFRRLQSKTQVHGIGVDDFHRTRLTHSLEAAQIGTGIASLLSIRYPDLQTILGIDEHLIESICLAHDIGHPPFGHGGEMALHYMMSEHGGFEGNAQTFRIVTKLETYSAEHGMNLARRTMLGLIKYPNFIENLTNPACNVTKQAVVNPVKSASWLPPKGLYKCDQARFEWVIKPFSEHDQQTFLNMQVLKDKHSLTTYKSFDCSVMELADDIAYAIHDLEDAIAMHMVDKENFIDQVAKPIELLNIDNLSSSMVSISESLFMSDAYTRKGAIGALVNCFITAIYLDKQGVFESPLLDYQAKLSDEHSCALNLFKQFIFLKVIKKPELQQLEFKGQKLVMSLFETFNAEPLRLLPVNTRERWEMADKEGLGPRIIADYISGMTDDYAGRLYNHLFMPNGFSPLSNFS